MSGGAGPLAHPDRWPDVLVWLGHETEPGARVALESAESHHLVRVLRRGPGDAVVLADGAGGWVDAVVIEANPTQATLEARRVRPAPTEPVAPVRLGFPILRPSRTEWLIEKATELGVTHLTPVRTERARPGGEKPSRWSRVVRSAAMQALRSTLPEIHAPHSLPEWIADLEDGGTRLVGVPGAAEIPPARGGAAALLVGPEGDLTRSELDALSRAAFVSVDLGPTRLRAETAAVVLLVRVTHARSR